MQVTFQKNSRPNSRLQKWASLCLFLFLGVVAAPPLLAQTKEVAKEKPAKPVIPPANADDSEVKLGRENAEEHDKQAKLVADATLVERVNRIGQDIAEVANQMPVPALWGSSQLKQFHYTFKIVDDKDVNAFSLPGGFIYVNKGLLDMVRSDDELAGVLAHEVAHAAHHHMVKLIREQNKIERGLQPLKILALLAMLVAKGGAADASNVLLATQLYTIAKINTYGIEAEKDADQTGIRLLTHTKYNPVGLYSFMIRLAALERSKVGGDLGIYRTHPPGEQRVESTKILLNELKIPIRLSEVDPTLKTTIVLSKDASTGITLAEIRLRDIVLCRVAPYDGNSAEDRARAIARKLDALIDARVQPFEVRINKDMTRLMVRGQVLLIEADALAQNTTLLAISRELSAAIARISQTRMLETNI